MRYILLLILGLYCMPALGQQPASRLLLPDTTAPVSFERVIEAPGQSQAVLYQKVKTWVITNLEPSDNYLFFNDEGRDSVMTIGFMTLDDLPQAQNQIVNFRALIQVGEGKVTFLGSQFVYRAINKATGETYDPPLLTLDGLPDPVKAGIYSGFDRKFERLIESLERVVQGP
jgi:hypothetical protein